MNTNQKPLTDKFHSDKILGFAKSEEAFREARTSMSQFVRAERFEQIYQSHLALLGMNAKRHREIERLEAELQTKGTNEAEK
jgi:hypothetical protein